MSAGSQQLFLVQYYSEYQKYLEENKKEIIEEMVCDYDLVIFDGFLFFDDMQKYIIKKACENEIPVCFVAKVLDKGVSNFLLEDNLIMFLRKNCSPLLN